MIWRLRIHCLVMCVGLVAAPVQNDPLMTGNFLNGRWWQSLDSGQKLCWLQGFREGAAHFWLDVSAEIELRADLHGQKAPSKKDAADLLNRAIGGSFTFSEMRTAIDGFYEEPANRQIPVAEAFSVMKRKFEGAPPDEIERLTATRRRWAQAMH